MIKEHTHTHTQVQPLTPLLTMPATTRPPTVPCEPIEDMAKREISDNCSGVMPPTPGVGSRQTGVVSTGVLTGVTTVCCKSESRISNGN